MCPVGTRSFPPAKDRRQRKEPGEGGPQLIYGRNVVREALRGKRRVHTVFLAERRGQAAKGGPADLEVILSRWLAETGTPAPPIERLTAEELSALLGTTEHQGVAAAVDPYPYLDGTQVLLDHTLVVALDGVEDPHNLGAVIRTAECAGAAVVIPRHRAAEVTPAVVRASAGATEHAAVARVRNLADFLLEAKQAGFWVYGAAAGADTRYDSQDYRLPTCFVLGSEGEGLGQRVASVCDVLVGLPLLGRIDSLNVSVATGVLLYEALRQRGTPCAGSQADSSVFPDEGG